MSSQRISVAITVLFVVAFAASVCYGECVCGETHELTVTITGTRAADGKSVYTFDNLLPNETYMFSSHTKIRRTQ